MRVLILFLATAVSTMPVASWAASIAWSSPFEIETDADLKIAAGGLLYAINGGDHTGPAEELDPASQGAPMNFASIDSPAGVLPLQWTEVNTGPGSRFDSPTFGEVTSFLAGDGTAIELSTSTELASEVLGDFDDALFDGLTVRADDVGGLATLSAGSRIYRPDVAESGNSLTGNPALDSVLNSSVWADGRTVGSSTLVVQLNDLTPGETYQVQIVANGDTRPPRGTTMERSISAITADDGLGNVSAPLGVFRDLDGDGFRHVNAVLGVFSADAESQTINLVLAAGRNPGFSLLTVSRVPEPSSALLVILGVVVAGSSRRR